MIDIGPLVSVRRYGLSQVVETSKRLDRFCLAIILLYNHIAILTFKMTFVTNCNICILMKYQVIGNEDA